MSHHPNTTPASPSLASPLFDASCDSIESLTTSFAASVLPTLETTTVTEAALGYHRNQQYSITAMTTSTGAVAERYAYTAYGQPTILNASGSPIGNQQSQIANRFTYTGREWDETLGLYHFRARWMSPLAGRFLGRDPIGYEGGWGLYELYMGLNETDPSGLCTNCPAGEDYVSVNQDLVTGITDSELMDNVQSVGRDRTTGMYEIIRRRNLVSSGRPSIQLIGNKANYTIECCVKKDLSSATILSATQNKKDQPWKDILSFPGGRGGWTLTTANKQSYIDYAMNVPFWQISPAPKRKETVCLESNGLGSLKKEITSQTPAKDIPNGQKNP
jgi:RHS repeat-associated protein